MIILPALGSTSVNPHPDGSPETSAESSSNIEDNHEEQQCINEDRSFSISHGDEDDHSTSADGSGYMSDKSRRSTNDEIVHRQQHIAYTRCAALVLVFAIAAAAGATTYVLTSQDQDEARQHWVRHVS
jgi:hypothetical protein